MMMMIIDSLEDVDRDESIVVSPHIPDSFECYDPNLGRYHPKASLR